MDIESSVDQILRQVTGSGAALANSDLNLFETGLLDSLGTAELLVALSERFGVEFSPAEFERELWATPRLIARRVQERMLP